MSKIYQIILSILLIIFLAACSANIPRGFYSQLQLADNIFRIKVEGVRSTPHQKVKDFALLRAAEITLEKGKQKFIILDDNIERMAEQSISPEIIIGTHTINGKVEPIYSEPKIEIKYKSAGTLTIEIIDKNDKRYKSAYDAKIIANQLTPILRAKDKDGKDIYIWLRE